MSASATTTVTLTLARDEWAAVRDTLADALRHRVEGHAAVVRAAMPGVRPGTVAPTVIRLLDALTARPRP